MHTHTLVLCGMLPVYLEVKLTQCTLSTRSVVVCETVSGKLRQLIDHCNPHQLPGPQSHTFLDAGEREGGGWKRARGRDIEGERGKEGEVGLPSEVRVGQASGLQDGQLGRSEGVGGRERESEVKVHILPLLVISRARCEVQL